MIEQSTIRTIYFITAIFAIFLLYNLGQVSFNVKQIIFIDGIAIARPTEIQRARINTARSLFREEPNIPEQDYLVLLGSQSVYAYYVPFSNSIGLSEYILDSLSEWDLAAVIAHEMAHAESLELVISLPKTPGKTVYDSIPVFQKPHYFFDIRAAELTSKEAVLAVLQKTHQNIEEFYRKNKFWFLLYSSSAEPMYPNKLLDKLLERIKQVRNADI